MSYTNFYYWANISPDPEFAATGTQTSSHLARLLKAFQQSRRAETSNIYLSFGTDIFLECTKTFYIGQYLFLLVQTAMKMPLLKIKAVDIIRLDNSPWVIEVHRGFDLRFFLRQPLHTANAIHRGWTFPIDWSDEKTEIYKAFFSNIRSLSHEKLQLLALQKFQKKYHDKSDWGMFATGSNFCFSTSFKLI